MVEQKQIRKGQDARSFEQRRLLAVNHVGLVSILAVMDIFVSYQITLEDTQV